MTGIPGLPPLDEDVYRLLAEDSADVVCVFALDGTLEWVSPSVTLALGFPPVDVVGTSPWGLVHPEDRGGVADVVAELLRTGSVPDGCEFRVRGADGGYRWVSARGQLKQAGGGAGAGFVVGFRDIDRQVRAEQALATSRLRLRLVAEHASDVVYFAGPDRIVQWISESVTRCLGWTPEELVGSHVGALVHPEDEALWSELREHVYEGGHVSGDDVGGPLVRLRTREGRYRWMTGTAAPVTGEAGELLGVAVGLRDVGDLVNAHRDAVAGEQRLRATLDSLLDPCVVLAPVCDQSGRIVDFEYADANAAACTYNGMPRERLVGLRALDLFPGLTAAGLIDSCARTIKTGQALIIDDQAYANELLRDVRWYDLRGTKSGDSLVLTWRDVTDRHETQQRLADSEALYRLVTDDVWDAVVHYDASARILWVSPSFETLTGYSSHQAVGTSVLTLIGTEFVPLGEGILVDLISQGRPREDVLQIRRGDGSLRWIRARSRPFTRADGSAEGFVTVMQDVQVEVETRARLEREIGHDSLTGLATWPLGKARVEEALATAGGASGRSVALLCLGVDRLKHINEAISYAGGDLVLSAVAQRVVRTVADPDRVVRVAGDEFAVLVDDLADGAEAARLAERLREAASGSARVGEHEVVHSVSIGIAVAEDGSTPDGLLRHASAAMHAAQAGGSGRWRFADPALADESSRRLQIETHLRAALSGGEVVAWYQPIVALSDEACVGYEALARWVPPGREALNPAAFLDVAERSGLVSLLDPTIMEQVARESAAFPPATSFAVNVASPTLTSPGYAQQVAGLLQTYHVDASRLHLEVTETMLLDATAEVRSTMNQLADLGIRWYVDDFGTGYSSLSHLRDLPIHGLKLDRSFTAGLESPDPSARQLASGLAGLALGLGLDTIAEGIETDRQAAILRNQGWSKGQGWRFGKPTPPGQTPTR